VLAVTKRIRRIVCALALGAFLTATATWAPQARASDELCPYVRVLGVKHRLTCITLP
jgi:hypothetical protein